MTRSRADHQKTASRISWVAIGLSAVANAVGGYALHTGSLSPVVSAAGHGMIPLLSALAKVLLVKTGSTGSRWVDGVCRVAAGVVGLSTVVLSAANLAHLGQLIGLGRWLKWGIPVAFDGLMASASVKAIALSQVPHQAGDGAVISASALAVVPVSVARKPRTKPKSKPKTRLDLGAFEAALKDDPLVTAQQLADRLGISVRHVQRQELWQNRRREDLVGSGVSV